MAAGLSSEGYVPLTQKEAYDHIAARLESFSPGFDLSPVLIDGQLVEITSFLLGQAYSQLGQIHKSYSPSEVSGLALRNLGLITGTPYGKGTRSTAYVALGGIAGTQVPERSKVADTEGNIFVTQFAATVPSSVQVVALLSGPVPVGIGTINTVESSIAGWTTVTQTVTGAIGSQAQTEVAFRNSRTKSVLKNSTSVVDVVKGRLELGGVQQVNVLNNDQLTQHADGTPAQTIHVTIGELTAVPDATIAKIILESAGLGCPTYGSTTVSVTDTQGHPHDVSFTKAAAIDIFIDLDVTFLSDSAGAEEQIREALEEEINSLPAGEDVVWSRLFGFITPYGKAQINSLNIGRSAGTLAQGNVVLTATEFAVTSAGNINIS